MSASLLTGLPIAEKVLNEVKEEAGRLRGMGIVPGPGRLQSRTLHMTVDTKTGNG